MVVSWDASYEADGYTVTTDTTTTTTTVTTTNPDSGDILDGDNDYVTSKYEGDMDVDWGGQGPASMPSGNSCYNLANDYTSDVQVARMSHNSLLSLPNILPSACRTHGDLPPPVNLRRSTCFSEPPALYQLDP